MKFKTQDISVIALLLLFCFMSSCNKENINDETVIVEDPVDTLYCNVTFDLDLGLGGIFLETVSINNINGGTAPFDYLWNTGETSQLIIAPTAGIYTATVTDDNNCTAEQSIEVTLNNILCDSTYDVTIQSMDTLGSVNLTTDVNGGTPPFTYLWSTSDASSSIIVTAPGVYTVTVTDDNNCTVEATFVNNSGNDFMAEIILTQDSTMQEFLSVNLTNGTPPYIYLWSTTETSDTIDVTNAAGNFSVTVSDANGSMAVDDIDL